MWSMFNGTIVNAATVVIGCTIGLSVGPKLPERYRRIVLDGLGLITIILGVDASVMILDKMVGRYGPLVEAGRTFGARLGMVTIGSVVIGSLIGTALKLHERLESLGGVIHRRFGGSGDTGRFAEGFLTASVIFCVGPLTLLGCLNNGTRDDPSLLYIKSALDAFSSTALSASLGAGVAGSILTILIFQGGLVLGFHYWAGGMHELPREMMNVVGGLMLIATALLILEVKKIPVANMLPGIFLPPLFIKLAECVQPGLFLPPS
ncbi:MAG: DUF554 domain-containing protein [bacterium]|nr:DUF554 domain-containing protein [bacterium]